METRDIYILLRDLFVPYFVFCVIIFFIATTVLHSSSRVGQSVLFVIAHPDDESMFFAPSISEFARQAKNIYLLCLSTGNFYHKGNIRENELKKSCGILGIQPDNCFVVKNSSLQDDPAVIWDKKLCGKVILDYIHEIKPDTILTFDSYGISGHKNHRSLYFALQYLISDGRLPEGIDVFCLDSVSLPRQYFTLFVLDLPVSLMTSDLIVVSPWRDFFQGQRACLAHWSQMEWFRILHLTFSRYMAINSYQKISAVSAPAT